jgi:NAD(P)-dependent dehydrogenase (short-subunit alcohol dehydrogenase family)
MWVLGFELKLLLIHKIMTTSGSIFLAGASRDVGYQIARILAAQNLPVLALIRWRSLPEVIVCRPIRSPGSKRGNGGG